MGLFKSIRELGELTKSATQLQRRQLEEAGYEPGVGGMVAQIGDLIEQASDQLSEINDGSADTKRLLREGLSGEGLIIATGTPARGAVYFNLEIDLEVTIPGREPYRIANQYIVAATAAIAPGITLPLRVDPTDPAKIAIDWARVASGPARGEIRPGADPKTAGPDSDSTIDQLERLAQLHQSGALSEAEFAVEKAKLLGAR